MKGSEHREGPGGCLDKVEKNTLQNVVGICRYIVMSKERKKEFIWGKERHCGWRNNANKTMLQKWGRNRPVYSGPFAVDQKFTVVYVICTLTLYK